MACIVVFEVSRGDGIRRSFGDLTVLDVLPATYDIGQALRENMPRRFGFFYITDRDWDDPSVRRFAEPDLGDVDEAGDRPVLKKRRWRILRSAVPGNILRFGTYHEWGADGSAVPNNVKFTAAQVQSILEDLRGR